MKKFSSISLLVILISASAVLAACSESMEERETPVTDGTIPEEAAAVSDTTEEDGFRFSQDYAGTDFRILNGEDIFSYHETIDPGAANGEALNDAQFNCCRAFEDKTGARLVETQIDLSNKLNKTISDMVQAGDDLYDIIYIGRDQFNSYAPLGYFEDLKEVEGLNLSEDWWLHECNDAYVYHDHLYRAEGYAQMSIVDGLLVLMFNESMAVKLDIELPYQAVIDGKWTLDMLYSDMQAAANLNGDDSFKWNKDGNCTWGCVFCSNGSGAKELFMSAGARFFDYNENGQLVLTAGNERFYNICEKASAFCDKAARASGLVYLGGVEDDVSGSYINAFEQQRTLFGQSEISKTNRLRNADFTFSVLPYPKYDESQPQYYANKNFPSLGVSIPVTAADAEKSGVLADALNCLGYEMVWPTFRSVTLEQKNLRNEDSIRMLDIILKSSVPFYSEIFGIDIDFVVKQLQNGASGVASALAKNENKIQTKLDEINGN